MIEVALILLAIAAFVFIGFGIIGTLDKLNSTLAVASAVQLAYLKHAEDEELQDEAAAIQLDLLVRAGLAIPDSPEGVVS